MTGGTFAAFRVRSFRLYLIGAYVSMTGSWLTVIAQSLLVYELTDSGFALGLIGACNFLPVLFVSSWAGLIADRYSKRRALMLLQSAALVQAVALALVATMDSPPLALLCVFAAVRGTTATMDLPIRRSMVVETVPPHLATNAIALNSASTASSLVFGAALGGVLVEVVGYSFAFLVDGATYVVAIVTLLLIRADGLLVSPPTPRRSGQVRDSVDLVRATPSLRIPLLLTAFTGFGYNFPVILPILVADGFGRPTSAFTQLYSTLSAGSVTGALLIARRSLVTGRLLARLAVAFGCALILLGINQMFWLAFPIAILVGLCGYALLAGSVTMIQTNSEPSMRGRIVSFHSIASIGAWAITAPLIGWLCEAVGPHVGIAVAGGTCVAAGVWAGIQVVTRPESGRCTAPA